MNDLLLKLAGNATARRAVRTLGLPLPLPQTLQRATGRDTATPLADLKVVWLAPPSRGEARANGGFAGLRDAIVSAGATMRAADVHADSAADDAAADAFIVDASDLATVADLSLLYEALHGRIGALARCGRVVVIARPVADDDPPQRAAARAGVEGFVRALGKELGRKGATANLLRVASGAEHRAAGPCLFLLSARSAFVSGQPLDVDLRADDVKRRGNRGVAGLGAVASAGALAGQVALVTGAARGIGEAIARRLAEEGARVICVDLPASSDALGAVATAIAGDALPCDLAAHGAIDALIAAVHDLMGDRGVDILVNNAGITRDRTIGRMPPAHWDLCLAVNLEAAVALSEGLLAHAHGLRDSGRIVFLSSIGGIAGNPGQTNYATAKRALMGYAAALADQTASRGISANCVAPGFIETQMTAAMPAMLREAGRRLSSLGQGGLASDIADAVAFLASPGAIGISGRTLRVCGQHLSGA